MAQMDVASEGELEDGEEAFGEVVDQQIQMVEAGGSEGEVVQTVVEIEADEQGRLGQRVLEGVAGSQCLWHWCPPQSHQSHRHLLDWQSG